MPREPRTPIKFTRAERAEARRTANTLLTKGWCQGTYTNPATGAHCAIGAIQMGKPFADPFHYSVRDSLEDKLDELLGSVAEFNDHPKRQLEDVLGVLDAVAKVGVI